MQGWCQCQAVGVSFSGLVRQPYRSRTLVLKLGQRRFCHEKEHRYDEIRLVAYASRGHYSGSFSVSENAATEGTSYGLC